jgi:hypothetical protein
LHDLAATLNSSSVSLLDIKSAADPFSVVATDSN